MFETQIQIEEIVIYDEQALLAEIAKDLQEEF